MKYPSKVVLSVATALYLLSSPAMAMHKSDKDSTGVPAKAAAAAPKADAAPQQSAASLKVMKKEFKATDLVAASAQTKVAAGAGGSVEVTASHEPSTYQVMYPLDGVQNSLGFRVAYLMETQGEEFNVFVLKNGGYLPQKSGQKIKTLGLNKVHWDVLEYDVQGAGSYLFVVGNNRKAVAPGASAASPTARVIIQNIHVEALVAAPATMAPAKAVTASVSAAAVPPAKPAAAAAPKPADKPEPLSSVAQQKEGIYRVNAGLYVGKRRQDTDLQFVISRVTQENFQIWDDFEKGQATEYEGICKRLLKSTTYQVREVRDSLKFLEFVDLKRPCGKSNIQAGLMAFRESLKIYKQYAPEVWIAYALAGTTIGPLQPITQTMFPHIEMVMTVLTASDAPMTVHMGIARSVYHEEMAFHEKLPKHTALAIPLHAFAAHAMKMHDPKKIWMRTCPTIDMGRILDASLPEKSYLKGKTELLKAFRWNTSNSIFEIYDPAGKTVLTASKSMASDWHWYFDHFYLGPPMTDYAVDINMLGQQFDKGAFAQVDRKSETAANITASSASAAAPPATKK